MARRNDEEVVMKVALRRSGGFAATIRVHPVVVDTTQVTPEQAARVDRCVAAARASGAWHRTAAPPSGADLMHYSLTVSEGGDEPNGSPIETVEFDDPIPDSALAALVDVVLELGQEES